MGLFFEGEKSGIVFDRKKEKRGIVFDEGKGLDNCAVLFRKNTRMKTLERGELKRDFFENIVPADGAEIVLKKHFQQPKGGGK